MTPKQELVAHLEAQHAYHRTKDNHAQLTLAHRAEHRRHLTHSHKPDGWRTGGEQTLVTITVSPPKNPFASRNGDRNWTLHIAHIEQGHGYRWEMAGTRDDDAEGALQEANRLLGWVADWEPVGWGWKVMEE